MSRAWIRCCLVLLVLLGCLELGLASGSATDTATDLDGARRRVAETQADANATAAEFSDAEGRHEVLVTRIDTLEVEIEATQRRVASLQEIVRERAVFAYTHPSYAGLALVFEADDALEGARRAQLLDHANENDNTAVRRFAALRSDLADQQGELRAQRDERARVKQQLNAKIQTIQTQLAEAAQARRRARGTSRAGEGGGGSGGGASARDGGAPRAGEGSGSRGSRARGGSAPPNRSLRRAARRAPVPAPSKRPPAAPHRRRSSPPPVLVPSNARSAAPPTRTTTALVAPDSITASTCSRRLARQKLRSRQVR